MKIKSLLAAIIILAIMIIPNLNCKKTDNTALTYGDTSPASSQKDNILKSVGSNSSNEVGEWIRTVYKGHIETCFHKVAVDNNGNLYAAGFIGGIIKGNPYIDEDSELAKFVDFGNNVKLSPPDVTSSILIVKYTDEGVPVWAKTMDSASNESMFNDIAVDNQGNIYAAGYIYGSEEYSLDNGSVITGSSPYYNSLLVKYSPEGDVLWSRTAEESKFSSLFYCLDISDNGESIYCAGKLDYLSIFYEISSLFGEAFSENPELQHSDIQAIQEKAYEVATNYIKENEQKFEYDFGNNAKVSGSNFNQMMLFTLGYLLTQEQHRGAVEYAMSNFCGRNPLLIKYDSEGNAQWARSQDYGFLNCAFQAVDEHNGSVYVCGELNVLEEENFKALGVVHQNTNWARYSFGNNKVLTGTKLRNGFVVRYNSSGTPVSAFLDKTEHVITYGAIAVDANNNIFVGGRIDFPENDNRFNFIVDKYNSYGALLKSFEPDTQDSYSILFSLELDSMSNVVIAGQIMGSTSWQFQDDKTILTPDNQDMNLFIAKLDSDLNIDWIRNAVNAQKSSDVVGITISNNDYIYGAGSLFGMNEIQLDGALSVRAPQYSDEYINCLIVKLQKEHSAAAQ